MGQGRVEVKGGGRKPVLVDYRGGGGAVSRSGCVFVCVAFPMCVQAYFCIQLTKFLPLSVVGNIWAFEVRRCLCLQGAHNPVGGGAMCVQHSV